MPEPVVVEMAETVVPRTEAVTAMRLRPARPAGPEDEVPAPAAEQAGGSPVAVEEDFGQSFGMAVRSCTVLIVAQEWVAAPRLLVVLEAGKEEPR